MLRPEFATRATPATEPLRPTQAVASSGHDGRAFGSLFGEVRDEVNRFIASGAGSEFGGSAASMLSVEGQVQRAAARASVGADSATQQAFLESIAPAAEAAAQRLGVAPELVAAHAALESGWGQRPLQRADGSDTHDLFGLKAGGGWRGDVASALTTEVEDGTAVKKTEPFRSYPDAPSAFQDYAQLLLDNPRYRGALNVGSDARAFAQGLARGGYATDPAYADKLARVAARLQSRD